LSWAAYIFFESWVALSLLMGVACFFLLVHWRRGGRPLPLLVGLAVWVVLFGVQMLVTTPREQARHILQAIEQDVLNASVDSLRAALAPDFRAGGYDAAGFVDMVRGRYEVITVIWLRRTSMVVAEMTDDRMVIEAAYLADVRSEYTGTFSSRWRITFARYPEGWQIRRIRPLAPLSDWRSIEETR
jgi:hypothetical protein